MTGLALDPRRNADAAPGPSTAAAAGQAQPIKAPFLPHPLAMAGILCCMTPIYYQVAGQLLTPSRTLFLLLVPYFTIRLAMGAYGRILLVDVFMYLHIFWLALSIAVNNTNQAVTFVGSQAVILLGGYLTARCTIRGPGDFIAFARFFGLMVLFTLPFGIYEALNARYVIPPLLERIPGVRSIAEVHYEPRMGLDRAQVVFVHPIHYGLFCSLAFSLVFIALRHRLGLVMRGGWAGLVGVACFMAVSSGPLLAMIYQIGLTGYAWVMRSVAAKWTLMMSTGAAFYALLEVLSDRLAIYVIVSNLAFNPMTAFVRMVLLEHGLSQIGRTPLLGIGYNEWELPSWMTGSIDNYWLLVALTYGVPAFVFLFGACLILTIGSARRPFPKGSELETLRFAYIVTIVSMMLALGTVAIWSEMASICFFLIGTGAWLMTHPLEPADTPGTGTAAPAEAEAVAPSRGPRYTRFDPAIRRAPPAPTPAAAPARAPRVPYARPRSDLAGRHGRRK